MDVVVEMSENDSPRAASVVLTYKFGVSISRKGSFELPLVAKDVPAQVVELLVDLHATPNEPVLSEVQKCAREATTRAAASAASSVPTAKIPTMMSFTASSATQNQDDRELLQTRGADVSGAPTVNPQVLKRRHVPSGTVYVGHCWHLDTGARSHSSCCSRAGGERDRRARS